MKMQAHPWYRITATSKGAAEILIYDEIVSPFWTDMLGMGVSAKSFAQELKALGELTALTIRINSPGGDVFEGHAIHSLLRTHAAQKTVYIDGIAASIASVIAMAGDRIVMPENAMMMIHDPAGGVFGTAADMRQWATTLDKISDSIIATYARKTGRDRDEIAQLMHDETWMTAEDAKAHGFADVIDAPVEAVASFDLSRFKKVPRPCAQRFAAKAASTGNPSIKETEMDPTITLDLIKEKYPQLAAALREEGRQPGFAEGQKKGQAEGQAAGVQEGASRERDRIKAVRAQHLAGHEALIDSLLFDGTTTGEQAAAKVLEAERTTRGQTLAALYAEAPQPVPTVEPGLNGGPQAGTEASWKAEWDRDAGHVQEEFVTYEGYLAFKRAEARGAVKILRGKASA
jgi:ATP-dependent Clp endopeptidase proteolytic subunit ClpP